MWPQTSLAHVNLHVLFRFVSVQLFSVKDGVATSVLSETANLQHLSIQEEDRKPSYEEDGPSVVIPDHLQVQSADCSHLSFGSFRSGLATGISRSRSSRNNMEETPIVDDASVIRKADMRYATSSKFLVIYHVFCLLSSLRNSALQENGVLWQGGVSNCCR